MGFVVVLGWVALLGLLWRLGVAAWRKAVYRFDWRSLQEPGTATVSWAVVTGSSYGLGRALARRLAADGFAVALVARDTARLAGVAAECEAAGAPATLVVAADWVAEDPEWSGSGAAAATAAGQKKQKRQTGDKGPAAAAAAVARALAGKDVAVLVNNVGGPVGRAFKTVAEFTPAERAATRDLTLGAAWELTRVVTPMMRARANGKGGAVLFVSSMVVNVPAFNMPYAAAKVEVDLLARGLQQEETYFFDRVVAGSSDAAAVGGGAGGAGAGADTAAVGRVQYGVARIGEVSTPSNGYAHDESDAPGWKDPMIATCDDTARHALRQFGSTKLVYVPVPFHALAQALSEWLPGPLVEPSAMAVVDDKRARRWAMEKRTE